MIGEIDGVKIIATPEQYKKCKKSLEKQLEEKDKKIEKLNKTIDEIREYIIDEQSKQSEEAGFYNAFSSYIYLDAEIILDKIKELQGSDKECTL